MEKCCRENIKYELEVHSPFLIFHLSNLDFELNLLVRYEHRRGGRREGKREGQGGRRWEKKGKGGTTERRVRPAESDGGLLAEHMTIDLHFYLPTSLF